LSPRVVAGREQLERKHGEYAAASEPAPYIAAAAYLSFVVGAENLIHVTRPGDIR
jgi:hypothetical protein